MGWYGDSHGHAIADPELRRKLREWEQNRQNGKDRRTREQVILEHHQDRVIEIRNLLKTARGERKELLEGSLFFYEEADRIAKKLNPKKRRR